MQPAEPARTAVFLAIVLAAVCACGVAAEPQTIVLWPECAPGSESKNPAKIHTVEGNALPDIKRAIRLVRSRAAQWGLDPERIGVFGFPADGELAALAATAQGLPFSEILIG